MLIRDGVFIGSFFLVAGSKTLINIGQTCLTADAAIFTFSCLSRYPQGTARPSNSIHIASVIFQIITASFSTSTIMLSRYPAIWDKLDLTKLQKILAQFNKDFSRATWKSKIFLGGLVFFGLLGCTARGMGAYLGVEVIVGDRGGASPIVVNWVGCIVAICVTLSAVCFNLFNMLTKAVRFLKTSNKNIFKLSILMSLFAIISAAVGQRYFIMKFLMRRNASSDEQIIMQSIFTLAELVLGLFTMTVSFENDWQIKAKRILKGSPVFIALLAGDITTTWLGYNMITWYSVLSDIFLEAESKVSVPKNGMDSAHVCNGNRSNWDFEWRWIFLILSFLISGPSTFAYFHYILNYAKDGYDRTLRWTGSIYAKVKNKYKYKKENDEWEQPFSALVGWPTAKKSRLNKPFIDGHQIYRSQGYA